MCLCFSGAPEGEPESRLLAVKYISPHSKNDHRRDEVLSFTAETGELVCDMSKVHICYGHSLLTRDQEVAPTLFVDSRGLPFTHDAFSNYFKALVLASEGRFESHFPATYLRYLSNKAFHSLRLLPPSLLSPPLNLSPPPSLPTLTELRLSRPTQLEKALSRRSTGRVSAAFCKSDGISWHGEIRLFAQCLDCPSHVPIFNTETLCPRCLLFPRSRSPHGQLSKAVAGHVRAQPPGAPVERGTAAAQGIH